MEKYKYLGKNIGILTISSFGTKLLSFLLVPLYTNLLSTTEYGIYDFFNTTISLLIPILTINIHDSVLRFSLDATEENKKHIFTTGLRLVVCSSLFIAISIFVNSTFSLILIIKRYPVYFFLMYVGMAFYQLLSNCARGFDRIKEVAISGVISSTTGLLLNVYLLAVVRMGLEGYLIATIVSAIIPSVYLSIKLRIWHYISLKRCNNEIRKQMVLYSAPLVLNAVGWWINNASDRYVVIALCGVAANGIYSVGYKIPSILNVFQTIFNQAWILSSVKEYDPEDTDGFFSKTYNVYNALLVIVCSFIICFNKMLAGFLYQKDFFVAWKYVPYLTIAIIFGALSGVIGGVFSATKDSKIFGLSTIIGAGVNVLLNIILVYIWGPIGAAVATMISYFVVWIIRLISLRQYMSLHLYLKRDLLAYCILIIMAVGIQCFNTNIIITISSLSILLLIVFFLFLREEKVVISKIKQVVNGK